MATATIQLYRQQLLLVSGQSDDQSTTAVFNVIMANLSVGLLYTCSDISVHKVTSMKKINFSNGMTSMTVLLLR